MTRKLITIPISHYCERARWALHLAGLDYIEEQHLQMFAWPYAMWAGGAKMVPVLTVPGQKALNDSADIVAYAHDNSKTGFSFYPDDEGEAQKVRALERHFAGELGVEARRHMYWHFFRWGPEVARYNGADAPAFERWSFVRFFPLAKAFAGRYLAVSEETAARAYEKVERIFDEVADMIKDGRPYLVGDRFSAADLCFACMSAAVLVPETYGVRLPQPDEMPEDTAQMVRHFRSHKAGSFALDLFARHHYRAVSK